MDKKIFFGLIIALPLIFFLGMIAFGRLSTGGGNPAVQTVQATPQPFTDGLKTVIVQGTQVAIAPGNDRLILENEQPPIYAIGVTAPAITSVPTQPFEFPTVQPGQQIVEITRIVDVPVTRFVDVLVTRIVDVTATPQSPGEYVLPEATSTPIPVPNPDPQDELQFFNYKVQPGDTLSGIAERFNTDFNLLLQYNQYRDLIYPGQTIYVPNASGTVGDNNSSSGDGACTGNDVTHTVVAGNTVYSIAILYNTSIEQIRQRNGLGFDYLINPGDTLCIPR